MARQRRGPGLRPRWRPPRFIGVIHRPDTELASHYMAASLPRQLDAWLWFDQSRAVVPLGPEHARPGAPDTWPFGLSATESGADAGSIHAEAQRRGEARAASRVEK